MSNHSITGPAGFNARVEPEAPKLAPSEGPVVPPTPASPRWIRTHADLVPSEARLTDINVDAIRDSVGRALAAHDRRVAADNGQETWRIDAKNLNESVRKGEITAEQAAQIFKHVHPTIMPEMLRGQS